MEKQYGLEELGPWGRFRVGNDQWQAVSPALGAGRGLGHARYVRQPRTLCAVPRADRWPIYVDVVCARRYGACHVVVASEYLAGRLRAAVSPHASPAPPRATIHCTKSSTMGRQARRNEARRQGTWRSRQSLRKTDKRGGVQEIAFVRQIPDPAITPFSKTKF
jgi:hypothetical protein